jgi:hypothetical protein
MDAVRLSDQSFVMLKLIHKGYHPHEIEIGQYLSTPAMQSDSRNHSVPLLDVLEVPDDSTTAIQVMPLLRKFNEPPFGTVGEVVDCISQAFQVHTMLQACRVELCSSYYCRASNSCTSTISHTGMSLMSFTW